MLIADGALTLKQRNDLLASMTDEVAALVLRDNYEQTQLLSLGNRLAPQLLENHARFIRFLEKEGRLNRPLEFLPSDDEIAERAAAGRGLTSPERSVLLAYAKIWLKDEVGDATLPDDPWVARALVEYFPREASRSLRRVPGHASAPSPDHHDGDRQPDGEPRRPLVRAPAARSDRSAGCRRRARPPVGTRNVRLARPVDGHRSTRQHRRRRGPGAHADRRRATDDQRVELVPAQQAPAGRHGRDRGAVHARRRDDREARVSNCVHGAARDDVEQRVRGARR